MTPEQLKYSILRKAFSGQLCEKTSAKDIPDVKEIEFEDIPYEIPTTWFWSSLGECCEMYTGNSIPESVKKAKYAGRNEGYDYISTKDVSFEHIIEYDNGVRIPEEDGFKVAYSGSVLMCIEGGSAGKKVGILDRDVCFGNKLCSFRSEKILNTYIYYYLQSNEFKTIFDGSMSGIIGGVSIKKLKELPIPIPPVCEQEIIVEKIEELLKVVKEYATSWYEIEELNAKFPEEIKKSLLQYAIQGKLVEQRKEEGDAETLYAEIKKRAMTGDKAGKNSSDKMVSEAFDDVPFDIPDTWKWVRLIDLIQKKPSNGFSPKGVNYETKYRNLTLTATTSGYFKFDAFKYIDIDEDKASQYWIKHNDILIQRSNSRELVGTSCIYTGEDNQYVYPDLMMRVHVWEEFVDVKYIDYVLKAPLVRKYYSSNATGTSDSMPKINQTIVAMTPIPLPPLEEQKRIVAKIEELLLYYHRLKE